MTVTVNEAAAAAAIGDELASPHSHQKLTSIIEHQAVELQEAQVAHTRSTPLCQTQAAESSAASPSSLEGVSA